MNEQAAIYPDDYTPKGDTKQICVETTAARYSPSFLLSRMAFRDLPPDYSRTTKQLYESSLAHTLRWFGREPKVYNTQGELSTYDLEFSDDGDVVREIIVPPREDR